MEQDPYDTGKLQPFRSYIITSFICITPSWYLARWLPKSRYRWLYTAVYQRSEEFCSDD